MNMVGTDVGVLKYSDFEKPFQQAEVAYTLSSNKLPQRCETCRFYRHKSLYDPCLLVQDAPLPIVSGGICSQFVPIREELPVLLLLEDESLAFGYDMTVGEQSLHEEFNLEGNRGFKMFGPSDLYWIAWYSNNFKDKDGEIFAQESLDYYNGMTAQKLFALPELWSYHQKYLKHGLADRTFRLGHFQMAVGKFDSPADNVLVDKFRNYYRENKVTMSHGYYYNPKYFRDGVYYRHQTFEVSTLAPGREANPFFTGLEAFNE